VVMLVVFECRVGLGWYVVWLVEFVDVVVWWVVECEELVYI